MPRLRVQAGGAVQTSVLRAHKLSLLSEPCCEASVLGLPRCRQQLCPP